VDDK
jgi:hypothetical protein